MTLNNFNLEERTALFGENVILLIKKVPQTLINKRIILQVIAAAGSIGANYCEASEFESKRDFQHKIGLCKKETKETMH